MRASSILAIYALFWVMSAFFVLPFGVRTSDEAGTPRVAGQADSAPHAFSVGRVVRRATILSVVAFGLYYLNYVNGWIVLDDLVWIRPPAE